MDEADFLENYLTDSSDQIDPRFIHEIPPVDGLEKDGRLIIRAEHEDTYSHNVIYKHVNKKSAMRLIEVYKNTQHRKTGIFVRLVGSMSLVKKGFPILFLDAAVTNVSPITADKEDITTRVVLHLPQANPDQRQMLFSTMSEHADKDGFAYRELNIPPLPGFWGPIWVGESKKFDLPFISTLRFSAWNAYRGILNRTEEHNAFDYRPVMEHMVFNNSMSEHLLFNKMGLGVQLESQSAFFTAMVSGIEALSLD
jgi:hypothetical protein